MHLEIPKTINCTSKSENNIGDGNVKKLSLWTDIDIRNENEEKLKDVKKITLECNAGQPVFVNIERYIGNSIQTFTTKYAVSSLDLNLKALLLSNDKKEITYNLQEITGGK